MSPSSEITSYGGWAGDRGQGSEDSRIQVNLTRQTNGGQESNFEQELPNY